MFQATYLYERTFQKANLTAFSPPTLIIGQQSSESQSALPTPTSNNFHFFMALDDLKRSDYLNRFNDVESLYQTNKNSGNTVNIGILNVDFAVFNGDPLATGALYVAGTDSLLYENSNSSVPLYKKIENSFVASPLKKDFKSKTVTFKLHSSFWKETAQYQITNLQIDFNDGQGYRTVNKGQSVTISYPTYGEKLIKFKATFSNNKTQTTNAKFEIVNASSKIEVQTNSTEGTNSCNMPTSGYIIEPSDDDTYTLRPIPCDELFNKNNPQTAYSESISVFDYNGNLMFTTKGDNVNVKNLKPGIYFIKANINNEVITKKIFKK